MLFEKLKRGQQRDQRSFCGVCPFFLAGRLQAPCLAPVRDRPRGGTKSRPRADGLLKSGSSHAIRYSRGALGRCPKKRAHPFLRLLPVPVPMEHTSCAVPCGQYATVAKLTRVAPVFSGSDPRPQRPRRGHLRHAMNQSSVGRPPSVGSSSTAWAISSRRQTGGRKCPSRKNAHAPHTP